MITNRQIIITFFVFTVKAVESHQRSCCCTEHHDWCDDLHPAAPWIQPNLTSDGDQYNSTREIWLKYEREDESGKL